MVVHQTIEYNQNLPAKIRLRDGPVGKCRGEPHWHGEIELLYVDSGTLHVLAGNQKHTLSRGDVLAAEQNPFDEYSALVKYSFLLKMLRMLLTRCGTEKIVSVYGAERSLDDAVTAVKHYIEANYRQKIMSTDLEKLMHFKPTYVMTHFKKQTGLTIMGYAIKVRANHALDDYLTHDIPVGEAAKKNGFCHYNHFTKACHKYFGASPTALKKARRQNQGRAVSLPVEIPA